MAPPRQRTAAVMDDSRSEASSGGTREYRSAAAKSRKPAGSTQKALVTSAPVEALEDQPRVCALFLFCFYDDRPNPRALHCLGDRVKPALIQSNTLLYNMR